MGRLTLGIRLSVDCSVRLSVSEDAQMDSYATQQAFTAALEGLVESIKEDRSILAAVLCGSLSHDTVWMKSDIDLVLVTIDDKKVESTDLALFAAVFDYLREAGEARSCTEIDAHFQRNFDVGGVSTACEYLADQGLIGKAGAPVHLTKKSNVHVQELAFFYTGEPPDG